MYSKSRMKWKSRIVVSSLLASLISPISLSQANTAQTLTICVSLKTGMQIISKSGNCNKRLYEEFIWFQDGNAPKGTPGSKHISMTTCRSKSSGNTQVIRKSCNRSTQTTLKWQRPLGPPEAPSVVSIAPSKLGSAIITVKAPEFNGGARITSYSIVQFDSNVTGAKSNIGSKFLGTSAVSYPLKSQEKISVGGLTPGQSYRFAAVATNVAGTSQLSESSIEYLAPMLPNVPTISSVTATGPGSALITFAVTDSGITAPITSFTITANPGGLESTVPSPLLRSHTFNGLLPLTSYTFAVVANSEAGSSPASEESPSVRTFAPQPPPEPVQTPSVPSAPASSAPAPIAAPVIALSSTSETSTAGVALTGYTVTSTGGAVANYSISPSAPAGLTFNASTGLLSGTPTVAASSTVYTVTGTNATGSATATFDLTVVVGPPSRAMLSTEPSGAVNGTVFTTQPEVRITDSSGNTITSSTLNVVATLGSGSGTLSGTTTVAANNGIATFTNLAISGSGIHTLTFTPTSLTAVTSNSFALGAGSASKAMITNEPNGGVNGVALTTQPVVRITDLSGNIVTSSTLSVVASIASGTGTLSGNTTVAAVNGVATFTNLVLSGTVGNFTLAFTPTSLTAATSSSFALGVGAATKAMITADPAGAAAGTAFTSQPVVRIADSSGNTVTSSTVNVVASIGSGSGGTLSGTTTVAAVNGVATFTDLVLTGTAGNFTLTFTPTSLTASTSNSFALSAGIATQAVITTQPGGAVNGSAFSDQPVIRITDASGNTVTSSTVNVIVSIASGSGTLSGTTTKAAVSGVATFTDLVISGTGNHTLTFTPTSLTAATSNTLSVTTPLVPSKVAVTRASVGTDYGATFTTQPQVTIQNENGDTVSNSSATVTATISAGGALIGTTSVNAVSGVATFTNLGLKGKAGNAYTITYTVSGLTTATQSVTPTGGWSLGDTGPGGGKVFYVASSGFNCGPALTEICYYLEVAPKAANTRLDWAMAGYKTTRVGDASGTAIGSGYKNTLAIIAQGNNVPANAAAAYAQAYRGGSLSDWYLGSTLELKQIYLNRSVIVIGLPTDHGFAGEYWTSTEDPNESKAYSYDVTNDSGPWPNQKNDNPVRPIRSF